MGRKGKRKKREHRPEGAKRGPGKGGSSRTAFILAAVILAAAVLAVFAQVGGYDFINYDDNLYVTDNHRIRQGLTPGTVLWAFRSTEASNWHPVTWLSHALDVELFGLNPGPHHLVNVLYHTANTVLLLAVLFSLTGALWRSAVVAALFALHPLHVESVAWIAERKDVLSTFFWLLTTWCYLRYVRHADRWSYGLALICFALGLMAKPMLVTLPFVLLLLDWWPLGRFAPRLVLLEKVPFLLLAGVSSIVTLSAQKGAMAVTFYAPSMARFSNALVSYMKYIALALWPRNLAVFYPLPHYVSPSLVLSLGSFLFLAGISFFALRGARKRGYFLVGWFWYLGTLVPVIGFIQVGNQALADRYTYVPLIGLFLLVVWGVHELAARAAAGPRAAGALAGVLLPVLALLSWHQAGYWRDSLALFSRTAAVTDNNWVAHHNVGAYYLNRDEVDKAIPAFEESLRILPTYAEAHYNLANALVKKGQVDRAITHYRRALNSRSLHVMANTNLGLALSSIGKHEEGQVYLARALDLDPDSFETNYNLGLVLASQGRLAEAEGYYRTALRINPDIGEVHNNLGIVLAQLGRMEEAVTHFNRSLQLNPDDMVARKNLRKALSLQR